MLQFRQSRRSPNLPELSDSVPYSLPSTRVTLLAQRTTSQKSVNQVVTDRVSGESTLRIALTALYVVVVKSIPSHLVLDVSSSKCFFGTPDYSFPDTVA